MQKVSNLNSSVAVHELELAINRDYMAVCAVQVTNRMYEVSLVFHQHLQE